LAVSQEIVMGLAIRPLRLLCGILISTALLVSCAEQPPPEPLATTPTFEPKSANQSAHAGAVVLRPSTSLSGRVVAGPTTPAPATRIVGHVGQPPLPHGTVGEALALEQVTLPQFIDEVFAKALKLNVRIDQAVMTRTDLITLRTGKALSGDGLLAMAEKILAGYGVGISWDGEVMHILPNDALMSQMPSLIRSRALPEIPATLRPIFQFVDLSQVAANDMIVWLTNAYGAKIKLFASPKTNSIMIFGLPESVAAAIEAAHALDQPRFAGRQSLRVSPIYWPAQALAAKLAEVLRAEGYDAAISSAATAATAPALILVPVEANNSLLAFAADAAVLSHIQRWVADLDKPGQVDPARNIFIYLVQNTTAGSLGATVQAVLRGGQPGGESATPEVRLEQAGRTQMPALGQTAPPRQPAPAPSPASSVEATADNKGAGHTGPRLVIDQARNALIFIGTAQDYEQVRPLLEAMDKAPREALIEVTVVELGLNETSNLGVEFTLRQALGNGLKAFGGTGSNVLNALTSSATTTANGATSSGGGSGVGLPIGSNGFNFAILNRANDARLLLNAFASNSKLSVLSTPRVLAKSGGQAKIEVGTEVPIITSQGSTNTIQNAGTTGILQSIEYRKTGVLLTVQPVVHSSDRIDLTVSQEVSQALPNTTPGISSPLIQNRNVSTQVALADGQTVVIGGLITEDRTSADSGVPYLKDIPGIGTIFRNQNSSKEKTELLVFITPYIVSDDADSERITEQFRDRMQRWPVPSGELRW
jgi:general secretion pathway protein D